LEARPQNRNGALNTRNPLFHEKKSHGVYFIKNNPLLLFLAGWEKWLCKKMLCAALTLW